MSTSGHSSNDAPWFKTAFGDLYLSLYAHRDQKDARRAVDFLLKEQIVQPHKLGLDLCCGPARHLVQLSEAGLDVVGFDLSASLLRTAQSRLDSGGFPRKLVRGSMNRLPFQPSFYWAINLFTSFGYFEQDTDNEQVLRDVTRALCPSGRFLMDFMNEPFVRATLKPFSTETTPDGIVIESRRSIEGTSPRVIKRMKIRMGQQTRELVESVRLYTAKDLEQMFARCGLKVVRSWGDFGDRRLGEMAPRCILLAEKV